MMSYNGMWNTVVYTDHRLNLMFVWKWAMLQFVVVQLEKLLINTWDFWVAYVQTNNLAIAVTFIDLGASNVLGFLAVWRPIVQNKTKRVWQHGAFGSYSSSYNSALSAPPPPVACLKKWNVHPFTLPHQSIGKWCWSRLVWLSVPKCFKWSLPLFNSPWMVLELILDGWFLVVLLSRRKYLHIGLVVQSCECCLNDSCMEIQPLK